jgi:putative tricarboxylic transport membrane protein
MRTYTDDSDPSKVIEAVEQTRGEVTTTNPKMTAKGMLSDAKEATRRGWKGTWIGSLLGFFVGILPAAGATPGSLMSYGVAKMLSKNPEEYGKGSPDGVAAPEAANNSASTGSMLPMLTLGIPGSPTTAILLGGMVIWGLTPGPRLFLDQSEFVWGLIGSFYISNIAAVVINLAFIPLFVWMLRMPFTILAPLIFVLSIIGGFAASRSIHDLWMIVIFGLAAFFLRKFDYPLAPAVLAIVLGPIAEPTLRQSLLLSSGDPMIFFTRPIAGPITIIAIILILLPAIKLVRRKLALARH